MHDWVFQRPQSSRSPKDECYSRTLKNSRVLVLSKQLHEKPSYLLHVNNNMHKNVTRLWLVDFSAVNLKQQIINGKEVNSCFGPEVNSSRISEAEQPIKLREKQYPPREYMLKCIIIFVKTLCKSVLFLLRDCMIDETISSISKSYFRATYTL
jgi:hypothetical protein